MKPPPTDSDSDNDDIADVLSPAVDFSFPIADGSDDLARAIADLAQLRASVQNNLRLRPIRSFSALPKLSSLGQQPPPPVSRAPDPDRSRSVPPKACSPNVLALRLVAPERPAILDTRPLSAHAAAHFLDSINIAIPSLILKRSRKPGSGFHSLAALRQFITSDQDKHRWDTLPSSPSWNGHIVLVHGEETDDSDINNLQVTPWALLPVLASLLGPDRVCYLHGGIAAAHAHPRLRKFLVTQSLHPPDPGDAHPQLKKAKGVGLFRLNTSPPTQTHFEIDQPTPSPLPLISSGPLCDPNSSPPPSQLSFRRPPPPRRPSAPNITRIITNGGGEQQLSLPRLHIRTAPTRSVTLPVSPSQLSASPNTNTFYLPPQSPSHLNLLHSHHTAPLSSPRWVASPTEFAPPPSPGFTRPTPPRTPETPVALLRLSPSPSTARPDEFQTASEESEFPTFTVSMILPNFLYLGPELTLPEHVQALKSLGVKRILNIAAECNDDHGLHLRENFERYVKIPMRDTIEEDQITKGLKEACEMLDEASLFGASTYVHCKAGKSRSVTAVMAYLIHANHWTLSRAYAFVLERRKGISPNIGFVSELMTFEEQELGGKSVGVMPVTPGQGGEGGGGSGGGGGGGGSGVAGGTGAGADAQTSYAYAAQSRRPGHTRESLPPMFTVPDSEDVGEVATAGQDMEIKDKEGRYRHMRRAPVDENTLQPMRRVSKAGLESAL